MDFETILSVENFIENLSNPRKQIIARELVVNNNFEIFQHELFGKKELFIKEKHSEGIYKLSAYLHTRCNCGQ